MAQFNYIPDANDQYTGVECLPAGEYKVQIIDTDIVDSKGGNAEMVKIVFEVVADAQFDGRKIFDNLIIKHETSDSAVRIGKQKLNTICALTSVKQLKDTAQLHGKTLSLLLGVKEYNGQTQNTIKKYLPFNGADNDVEDEAEDFTTKKPKFIK